MALTAASTLPATSTTPALRVDGVTVYYGSHCALADVTLELPAGFTAALIGPNGAGKSTLLHVLAGIVTPTAGVVSRPPSVAYMPHHRGVRTWMPLTVSEVVNMGCYRRRGLLGRLGTGDRRAAREAADRMEIGDLMGRQFGELSTGQRQRVLMAQVLVQDAGLLLLDEPITGLDIVSQARILEVVDEERERGVLVVMSTHHLDEANHCDHVLLLAGRLLAQGPPREVLRAELLRSSYAGRTMEMHEWAEECATAHTLSDSETGRPVHVTHDHHAHPDPD